MLYEVITGFLSSRGEALRRPLLGVGVPYHANEKPLPSPHLQATGSGNADRDPASPVRRAVHDRRGAETVKGTDEGKKSTARSFLGRKTVQDGFEKGEEGPVEDPGDPLPVTLEELAGSSYNFV